MAVLAGCAEEAPKAVVTAPPVLVAPVELREIVDRIEATGQLLAKSEASVAAQVGGQVTEIHFDEGARVESGDVLLEIDPERRELEVASQRALVAERKAQLADARREAKRIRNLREKGASSQSQVDEAETGLALAAARTEAARAQLGLAQRALADSSIKAPFAGQIAERQVSEGEFVSAGKPLMHLVSQDGIEVEFHLAERDSGRVALGAEVGVRVAPFPDEVFRATVVMISPTIDARTRTLRVKASVEDAEGRLKPGLFARADLGLRTRSGVIMIPEEAVILRADGPVVFVLTKDDQVARVAVETGVQEDGWLEIASGLSPDDVVVLRGQTRLIDGSVVKVRDADGGLPVAEPVLEQAAR
jgi:membrane fusion protein (multidrug efflux system)